MRKVCGNGPGEWYARDWMRLDGRLHDVEVHVEPDRTRHWIDGEPRWKWMWKHPLTAVRVLAWTHDFMARARTLLIACGRTP